jgi:biotin carboxyl carrier protein
MSDQSTKRPSPESTTTAALSLLKELAGRNDLNQPRPTVAREPAGGAQRQALPHPQSPVQPGPASHRPPIEPAPPRPPIGPPPVSDSMRGAATAGWTVIILFFGVLGAWAVTAPLHGAVVANGVVKVEGNRKSVQHLDGGIVKELRVREGDHVAAGDVVVVLDDTQARTEYEVLSRQAIILRATEARLTAELTTAASIVMPPDL